MKVLLPLLSSYVAVLAACGSSSSVTGTVDGKGLSVADSVSVATSQPSAAIAMSSSGGLCGDLTANVVRKNETGVLVELADYDASNMASVPTAPGTYTIWTENGTPPAKAATLRVSIVDDSCQDVAASEARANTGTVVLTAVSGNVFTGTFDVVLDSGDHITGSFDPEACPGLATALDAQAEPTCK